MMRSAMAFSSIVHSPYISLQIQVQTNALQSPATPLIIIQHKSNPFHLNSKKYIYSARASRKDHPTGQKGGASPWHLAIMLAKKRMNRKAVMKCPSWHIPPRIWRNYAPGAHIIFPILPVPQDGGDDRCAVNWRIGIHGPDDKLQLALDPHCHVRRLAHLEHNK